MPSSRILRPLVVGLLIVTVTCGLQLSRSAAQALNCSFPPEEADPSLVVASLVPADSLSLRRVLQSPFGGELSFGNYNVTGIITQGTGGEVLDVRLADDIRDRLRTDLYTATLWQIFPLSLEPRVKTGTDIAFSITTQSSLSIFLLLTVNQTPRAVFPSCYTEKLTLQGAATTSPSSFGDVLPLSIDEEEDYVLALEASLASLQHTLETDAVWRIRLGRLLHRLWAGERSRRTAAALRDMLEPFFLGVFDPPHHR